MAETLELKNSVKKEEKAHRWRRCPVGKHLVREHLEHIPPSKTHPEGMIITRHEHCAGNPSHKDELSYDEIQYITEKHFSDLTGAVPIAGVLTDFPDESKYDQQIRGWTEYWNDIFKLSDPLDPNLVKALIATESSFKINPEGTKNAYGLMQVRKDTLGYLGGAKRELKNFLICVSKNELLDPSVNICAGVRWLFRKKEIVSSQLGREATWFEAIAAYKSVSKKKVGKEKGNKEKRNLELMRRFYEHYKSLQEAKNKL